MYHKVYNCKLCRKLGLPTGALALSPTGRLPSPHPILLIPSKIVSTPSLGQMSAMERKCLVTCPATNRGAPWRLVVELHAQFSPTLDHICSAEWDSSRPLSYAVRGFVSGRTDTSWRFICCVITERSCNSKITSFLPARRCASAWWPCVFLSQVGVVSKCFMFLSFM